MKNIWINHKHIFILALILISGGFFIFTGMDWGLPAILHPDERYIIDPATDMLHRASFEPDGFEQPAHLLKQMNMLFYRTLVLLKVTSIEGSGAGSEAVFYLAARIISCMFAIGSIILAYFTGRRYGKLAGLTAAFMFAYFPLFIRHAHYATPDMPAVFFMLLFIYMALNYMQKPSMLNLILMSLVTAAFITVKYPGAILCLMIAISVIVKSIIEKKYTRIFSHGATAIFLIPCFIFLISPVLILKTSLVRQAFLNEARSTHLGSDGLGWGGNLQYYFNSFWSAAGVATAAFFFVGCWAVLSKKKDIPQNLPLFYSFIFWICLSYMPLHWERWGLPMHVSPLLISAIGVSAAYELVRANAKLSQKHKKYVYVLLTLFLCTCALGMITRSFGRLRPFLVPDTQTVSLAYTEEQNITAENSVFEGYTTLNPGRPDRIWDFFEAEDGIQYLYNHGIENVILSSTMYGRYQAEPDRYAKEVAFYDSLRENYTETQRFSPSSSLSLSRQNGWINIWRIVDYLLRDTSHEMTGPTIVFYKADSSNFIPHEFSDPIYFDDGRKSYDKYYISGLSRQEAGGVWTSGNKTEFTLYLPDTEKDLLLSITAEPFVSDAVPTQMVEVVVNGRKIDSYETKEPETHETTIPNGLIEGNRLNIKLLLPTAVSPQELGISDDERVIALKLTEMSISETD